MRIQTNGNKTYELRLRNEVWTRHHNNLQKEYGKDNSMLTLGDILFFVRLIGITDKYKYESYFLKYKPTYIPEKPDEYYGQPIFNN